MNEPQREKRILGHFHQCTHCGSTFRREEFENRALTSGVYPCPKCGHEGPLNVVVREVDESERDKKPRSDDDSAS